VTTTSSPDDEAAAAEQRAPWVFGDHPGFARSMDLAGTIAAPLLAGFSFTLLVAVLPILDSDSRSVVPIAGTPAGQQTEAFSRFPEVAGVMLLLAGVLLVMCVQFTIRARYYGHSPNELEELNPEYFRDDPGFTPDKAPKWVDFSDAARVGDKWYAGPVRHFFESEWERASKARDWGRNAYHAGILSLLTGIAFLVTPPGEQGSFGRWAMFGIAAAGVLAELAWIVITNRESIAQQTDGAAEDAST
jgi:hypothetical protein